MIMEQEEILFGYEKNGPREIAEVTVAISSYNYAYYIEEAFDSIKSQTLENVALIIVDDCSTDNSVDVISDWLRDNHARFSEVTLIRHYFNKGLPETRNTALRFAKTPFIFILDADNTIYPRCLESLLTGINNTDASFAYCYNEMFGSSCSLFNTKAWDPKKLKEGNFIDAMVLIRRDILSEAGGYTTSLINGMEDYELWIKIAKMGGWGVQIPEILARYRVHRDSMFQLQTIPEHDKILSNIKEIHPDFYSYRYPKKFRRVRNLIVIPDYDCGGAQRFAIRLANELSIDNDVWIYSVRSELFRQGIFNMIDRRINILRSTENTEELRKYINEYSIDIINSHGYVSDKHVLGAVESLGDVPWVVSMHGCYEDAKYFAEIFDKDFFLNAIKILTRANRITYAADKNKFFFRYVLPSPEPKSKKIYYGYIRQDIHSRSRKELAISQADFIFGIVSRATHDKGWEEAIISVIKIKIEYQRNVHLILVGDSEYAQKLRKKYANFSFIHFVGYSPRPEEWIQIFDAGLLPTFFRSESLPNSIIEYLAYNKPVIATDIGEIKRMLLCNTDTPAGLLISLNKSGIINTDELIISMKKMMENYDGIYETCKKNTRLALSQFDMQRCVQSYVEVFNECIKY